MKLVRLKNVPIYDQLQLEEALLRASTEDWCLINSGSTPAIVMGISGNPEELITEDQLSKNSIPQIRRFSGGGCVVVDEETLFLTFICNMASPSPPKIHDWVHSKICATFENLPFKLKESDYLLDEKKMGGNAQAITKNRFLHHTSFLYKYNPELMALLKMPKKTPDYRAGRDHESFVTTLSPFFDSHDHFFEKLISNLPIQNVAHPDELLALQNQPHRKALTYIRAKS